ncbi:MAG: hypothetical protein KBC43_11285 [Bacteroidales bacterium]|nr:hypothetical protein [Bacteroidales bacterium]
MKLMLITRYSAVKPPVLLFNGSIAKEIDFNDPGEYLKTAYRQLNLSYPKFFKMDNLCKLAFLTTEILLKDFDLSSRYASEKTGLIILNSSSSLETDEKHQESISDRNNYFPSPSVFVYTLPNIMTGELAIRHKIKGENSVFITEKPDAEFLHGQVSELFDRGRVNCCIAGWVEAYHEKLTSCLFLVENIEMVKEDIEPKEIIIFAPSNIERIIKETTEDGTY